MSDSVPVARFMADVEQVEGFRMSQMLGVGASVCVCVCVYVCVYLYVCVYMCV